MHIKDPARQLRSLRTCHLPVEQRPLIHTRESEAFIPELSERLERDKNLCDGARRCARMLSAYTYRRDRESRTAEITVTYLSKALGRCRRTVQRYLRQLERAGYIRADVIASERSRLCVGLVVTLLRPLFARHHAQKWPTASMNSAATRLSQKHSSRYKIRIISSQQWATRCMDGVFRSLMRTLQPLPASF
jgi:Helix-turn-helix domain